MSLLPRRQRGPRRRRTALASAALLLVGAVVGLQAHAEPPSHATAPESPPAPEPAACGSPFSRAATEIAPQALLAQAAHCADPLVAKLLRNRAEHAKQLRGLAFMSQLQRQGGNNDHARLSQCRMYTGLAEAFAERMQRDDPAALPAALAQLNLAYSQAIYIAERTIKGHEHIVGLPMSPR